MKKSVYQLALVTILLNQLSACSFLIGATRSGPITQNPKARTLGDMVDDQSTETIALVNIRKADPALKKARLVVVSYNGIVLITGQVTNERIKRKATEVVKKLKKVKKVYNELQIGGPIGLPAQSSDSWITSKIRFKILADKRIASDQIKVVTENGTVYLMGIATPATSELVVNIAKSAYGVQRIVKLFEYVD